MASIKFAETITVRCMGRFLCKKSAKLYHRTQSHMDRNPPDRLRLRLKHCGSDREPSKKRETSQLKSLLNHSISVRRRIFRSWQGGKDTSPGAYYWYVAVKCTKSRFGHFLHETFLGIKDSGTGLQGASCPQPTPPRAKSTSV